MNFVMLGRWGGRYRQLVALLAALWLSACGGADPGTGEAYRPLLSGLAAAPSSNPISLPGTEGRRRPLASQGTIGPDLLLDWAERTYADLFPKGAVTQRLAAGGVMYTVRYYPATGNYVGITDDGGVWGYGPFTGNALQNFGNMAEYTCLVSPKRCEAPPPVCKTEITTGFTGDLNATYANAGVGADGGADGGSAGVGGSEGKVLGGRIKVIRLSDGAVLGEGLTDSTLGLTTIRWCKADMPVMLELRGAPGAKYFDEAVNGLVDFPLTQKLRALVDRFDENVGVSALTEAAYMYAMNNIANDPGPIKAGVRPMITDGIPLGMSAEQVRAVNAHLLSEVNRLFTDRLQHQSVMALATPLDGASGASALPANRYGRMAALTGGFAKISGGYLQGRRLVQRAAFGMYHAPKVGQISDTDLALNSTPAFTFSRHFARDFTDGRINGFSLDGQATSALGERSFDPPRVSENWALGQGLMGSRFGSNSIFPSADSYIASIEIADYSAACPSEKLLGRYHLSKDGSVTEVLTFPGSCEVDRRSVYTLNSNILSGVRGLSDYHVSNRAFAIMLDGSVFAWGSNQCGGLGLSSRAVGYQRTPQRIEGLDRVVGVTAVGGAVFALTADGDVYGWGQNFAGIFDVLGVPFDSSCEVNFARQGAFSSPRRIPQLSRVKYMSSSQDSVLVTIDADGVVRSLGQSVSNGTNVDIGISTLRERLDGAVKIEPLGWGTAALRRDGSVWAWQGGGEVRADRRFGLVGIGFMPTPLRNVADQVDILTDARSSLLISLDAHGRISLLSGVCKSPKSTEGDYVVLNQDVVAAEVFPVRSGTQPARFPRALRLVRFADSVAFVGADGVIYTLDASGPCASWEWRAFHDDKLDELIRSAGQPVRGPISYRSAGCQLRPEDAICQDFNNDAAPAFPNNAPAMRWAVGEFKPSDGSDALVIAGWNDQQIMQYGLDFGFPLSGTIEMRVLVTAASERDYRYPGGFRWALPCAPLFLTDWNQVTWPGSTWLYACPDGTVFLEMAAQKGSTARQLLRAEKTEFRYGKWVRVGISYGSAGQAISIDGVTVAVNATNRQTLGSGGTEEGPRGRAYLGFYRSDAPLELRKEGGFEGLVDWFRVSGRPQDWLK